MAGQDPPLAGQCSGRWLAPVRDGRSHVPSPQPHGAQDPASRSGPGVRGSALHVPHLVSGLLPFELSRVQVCAAGGGGAVAGVTAVQAVRDRAPSHARHLGPRRSPAISAGARPSAPACQSVRRVSGGRESKGVCRPSVGLDENRQHRPS